jgi:hypothetical protein
MSHDLQAAWAASEIAHVFTDKQDDISHGLGAQGGWSFYASREGKREWPMADGVIVAENRNVQPLRIALEYKRPNEGLHGILTALGQSLTYLEKGFNGSVIVIPREYESHRTPGEHLDRVLQRVAPSVPVSIYTYSDPDTTTATPFRGKLSCVREIKLVENTMQTETTSSYVKTLWVHLREGSSDPDAFYRYCQVAKRLTGNEDDYQLPELPKELVDAVCRLAPNAEPYRYLSYSVGDSFLDNTWRYFWFTYIFNETTLPIYTLENGTYVLNQSTTKIKKSDGTGYKRMNVGRSDSPKNKAVEKLNSGEYSEDEAWDFYAKKMRDRAHSYREDIDSGLAGIGFLTDDGRLTDLGYKFVDACERTGNPNGGIALDIFGSSILKNGQLGAFLYYIYKLSEQKFKNNPLAFSSIAANGKYSFNRKDYKAWLEERFHNELYIMRKVSARGGASRQPFQAELAILRGLGYVRDYRVGVGLEINWPKVQESMDYFSRL